MKPIGVNTTVMYSRQWLRSTGTDTGPLPFAEGRVLYIEDLGETKLAHIEWDDASDDIPRKVNVANLIRKDQRHLEPQ